MEKALKQDGLEGLVSTKSNAQSHDINGAEALVLIHLYISQDDFKVTRSSCDAALIQSKANGTTCFPVDELQDRPSNLHKRQRKIYHF